MSTATPPRAAMAEHTTTLETGPELDQLPTIAAKRGTPEFEAALEIYSDGRLWNEAAVAEEVAGFLAAKVRINCEIGKRLIWAKHMLPHGQFMAWVGAHFPYMGRSTAQNYMVAAEFFLANPGFAAPFGSLGIKKVLLLQQIPQEDLQNALEEGHIHDVDFEAIKELPYPELKKKLKQAEKALEAVAEQLVSEQDRREKAEAQVRDMATLHHSTSEADIDARLDGLKARWQALLTDIGQTLDPLARRLEDFTPRLRAKVAGLPAAMLTAVELEDKRFRELAGLETYAGAVWEDLRARPQPAPDVYPFPAHREPPMFDDSEADEAPAGKTSAPATPAYPAESVDDDPSVDLVPAKPEPPERPSMGLLDAKDFRAFLDDWERGLNPAGISSRIGVSLELLQHAAQASTLNVDLPQGDNKKGPWKRTRSRESARVRALLGFLSGTPIANLAAGGGFYPGTAKDLAELIRESGFDPKGSPGPHARRLDAGRR